MSHFVFAFFNISLLTKVPTESGDEQTLWLPRHRTGSARSEGFYKISRKDKLMYLNCTQLTGELPSTSTQVLKEGNYDELSAWCVPAFAKC